MSGDTGKTGRMLVHGGVLLLTIGMIAVIIGIRVGAVFLPGTWIIALAFLAIAGGGIANVISAVRTG